MPGSIIRFAPDSNFYSIIKNDKIFVAREFETLDPRRIRVKGNSGIKINKGDYCKISYKQYELSTLSSIVNGGSGYQLGDIIRVNEGYASHNLESNTYNKTEFEITEISETGEILQVSLKSRGIYNIIPPFNCSFSSKYGSGAIFELSYNLIDEIKVIERQIHLVNSSESETIIIFDYSLPEGIKKGNLSIEKWEATLKETYIEETKVTEPYELFNDFTPYLGLPIPSKNSFSMELVIKEGFFKLDRKIQELETKLASAVKNAAGS
jgi:hypothetical protein